MAKRKAAAPTRRRACGGADVKRLTEVGVGRDYGLLLDLGCFHSIPDVGGRVCEERSEAARTGGPFYCSALAPRREAVACEGREVVAPGEVAQRFAGPREVLGKRRRAHVWKRGGCTTCAGAEVAVPCSCF